MEKMVDVYRQNPSLGDPNTIEQQLSENARELDALNEDLHKYQVRWKLLGGLVCLIWVRANLSILFSCYVLTIFMGQVVMNGSNCMTLKHGCPP